MSLSDRSGGHHCQSVVSLPAHLVVVHDSSAAVTFRWVFHASLCGASAIPLEGDASWADKCKSRLCHYESNQQHAAQL